MTIEEKARAYDEALKRARKLKENPMGAFYEYSPKEGDTICDYIFPELKKSEDEEIRKEIISALKNANYKGVYDKHLAWLEKQSKQKSADKVEQKFHIGEWITNGDYTWQIFNASDLDYILRAQDGNIVDDTISHVDEQFHSFIIEDANDGDVLQLGKVTAIFQKYIGNGNCKCYCSVFDGKFEISSTDNIYGCIDAVPATKEQRELLFQKMKEKGYELDAEKKGLKKIEQKSDSFCKKHCKGFQETGKCFADGDCKAKREAVSIDKIEDEPENYKQQVMTEMTDLVKDYIRQCLE